MTYSELNAEWIRSKQYATNCMIEFGKDSREYIDALQDFQIINQRIISIERSIGSNSRPTGNYARAIEGL